MRSAPATSLIYRVGVSAVFPVTLVFSIYLLFAGHDAPGGGFIGGLVVGAALVLLYLGGGTAALRQALPVDATVLLGAGLLCALLTAIGGLLASGDLLRSSIVELDVGAVGSYKLTTSLVFDVGVYATVVGLVHSVLCAFGETEPPGMTP